MMLDKLEFLMARNKPYCNCTCKKWKHLHLYGSSSDNNLLSLCFKNLPDTVASYLNILCPRESKPLLIEVERRNVDVVTERVVSLVIIDTPKDCSFSSLPIRLTKIHLVDVLVPVNSFQCIFN